MFLHYFLRLSKHALKAKTPLGLIKRRRSAPNCAYEVIAEYHSMSGDEIIKIEKTALKKLRQHLIKFAMCFAMQPLTAHLRSYRFSISASVYDRRWKSQRVGNSGGHRPPLQPDKLRMTD
jgi:hypothetical protein